MLRVHMHIIPMVKKRPLVARDTLMTLIQLVPSPQNVARQPRTQTNACVSFLLCWRASLGQFSRASQPQAKLLRMPAAMVVNLVFVRPGPWSNCMIGIYDAQFQSQFQFQS